MFFEEQFINFIALAEPFSPCVPIKTSVYIYRKTRKNRFCKTEQPFGNLEVIRRSGCHARPKRFINKSFIIYGAVTYKIINHTQQNGR